MEARHVDRHIFVPADAESVNLVTARDASEEEIRAALRWEAPPPPPKPAPKPIEYRTISREEDPTSSRLGFTAGGTDSRAIYSRFKVDMLRLSSQHQSNRGALDVSLSVSAFCSQRLEIALYDAIGNRILDLNLTDNHKQFDQRRLEAGGYLLAFRSPGPGVTGEGSRNDPNSRLLSDLPERPLLDATSRSRRANSAKSQFHDLRGSHSGVNPPSEIGRLEASLVAETVRGRLALPRPCNDVLRCTTRERTAPEGRTIPGKLWQEILAVLGKRQTVRGGFRLHRTQTHPYTIISQSGFDQHQYSRTGFARTGLHRYSRTGLPVLAQ